MENIEPKKSVRNDEINLFDLIKVLWRYKWLILGVSALFVCLSIYRALGIANQYTATAIVQDNTMTTNGGLDLNGKLGGLATLAGVDLSASKSTETKVAIEVLKSWGFIDQFISKHAISKEVNNAVNWDKSVNKLIYSTDLEKNSSKMQPFEGEPNLESWSQYKSFLDRLDIKKNQASGLFEISFTYYSPYIAKQWLEFLISDLNEVMRQKMLNQVNKNIKYLEEEVKRTNVAELRVAISNLIQEQHRQKMVASGAEQYVFKVISEVKVPAVKSKPRRALIVIVGALIGLIFSLLIVFFLHLYKFYIKAQDDKN